MIVKFFKRGSVKDNHYSTGGESAKRYLLGKDYADGVASRDHARLLAGDPDEVTEIINGLEFSKIYTSGCLAFDGEESKHVTEAMKQQLMDEFEHCLFVGLDKAQYAGYWVEHQDKIDETTKTPRLELNFVFANVELVSGKALPVYYHPIDENRVDTFKEIKNLEMNLTDPNAVERIKLTRIGDKLPEKVKETLKQINNELVDLFSDEKVNHRADVIAYLSKHYEITAIKNQSISIKNPHGGARPIRLQGALYEKTFESRGTLGDQFDQTKNHRRHRDSPDHERISKLKADYQRLCDKRSAELSKRFKKRAQSPTQRSVTADKRVEPAVERAYRFVDRPPSFVRAFRPARSQLDAVRAADNADRGEIPAAATDTYSVNRDTNGELRQSDPASVRSENQQRTAGLSRIFTPATPMAKPNHSRVFTAQQATRQRDADSVLPASAITSGQSRSAVKSSDMVDLRYRVSVPTDVYSSDMGEFHWLSDIPARAGGVANVTQSPKPTVRDRLKTAFSTIIEQATTAVRGIQAAVRARQSITANLSGLARAGYQYLKANLEQRNAESTRDQHTSRQFTQAQSAVSRASDTVKRAIPTATQPAPEQASVVDDSSVAAKPAQPGFGIPEPAATTRKPKLGADQSKADSGQSSNFKQIGRMDHVISGTKQQNNQLDDTIEFITRRQATLAEQERQAKLRQQAEQRTEFEASVAKAIKVYFEKLKREQIEADYDFKEYSLNRALQAVIGLRVSQKLGDAKQFQQATVDYKRAMVGITPTNDDLEMRDRVRDGSIGFSEKLRQKETLGTHYQKNKPEHLSYMAEGIKIAQALNYRAKGLVNKAIEEGFIEADYPVEPYKKDLHAFKPLVTLFEDISDNLKGAIRSNQQPKPSLAPEPASNRRNGPGFY
mgnify:CR=1 FL=1